MRFDYLTDHTADFRFGWKAVEAVMSWLIELWWPGRVYVLNFAGNCGMLLWAVVYRDAASARETSSVAGTYLAFFLWRLSRGQGTTWASLPGVYKASKPLKPKVIWNDVLALCSHTAPNSWDLTACSLVTRGPDQWSDQYQLWARWHLSSVAAPTTDFQHY